MSGIVYLHAETAADALIVLDASRRTYMALGRGGSHYHLIAPLEQWHPLVGDGRRHAGQLGCTCQAGTFRGTCYQVSRAEAFEGTAEPPHQPFSDLSKIDRPMVDEHGDAIGFLAVPPGTDEEEPAWLDSPAGAGESVEAFRG